MELLAICRRHVSTNGMEEKRVVLTWSTKQNLTGAPYRRIERCGFGKDIYPQNIWGEKLVVTYQVLGIPNELNNVL